MRNRKIFVNTILILALVALLFVVAVPAAFAQDPITPPGPPSYSDNPGIDKASNSGQFHGAFTYYAQASGGWIPGAAQQGGLGDTTGPANACTECWGGPTAPSGP